MGDPLDPRVNAAQYRRDMIDERPQVSVLAAGARPRPLRSHAPRVVVEDGLVTRDTSWVGESAPIYEAVVRALRFDPIKMRALREAIECSPSS